MEHTQENGCYGDSVGLDAEFGEEYCPSEAQWPVEPQVDVLLGVHRLE